MPDHNLTGRWPTRKRLVLAALARPLGELRAPDTGCTLCDLNECITVFVATFQRLPPDVLGSVLADCANDPELRAAFMSALFDPPVPPSPRRSPRRWRAAICERISTTT